MGVFTFLQWSVCAQTCVQIGFFTLLPRATGQGQINSVVGHARRPMARQARRAARDTYRNALDTRIWSKRRIIQFNVLVALRI